MRNNAKQKITKDQKDLLIFLEDEEIDIFTFSDIENRFGIPKKNFLNLLAPLVHHKLLVQIEKGKYCRPNFNNHFVISNYLCKDSAVAYWSALNHYGLTEQIPNTVFAQTARLKRPKNIFNVNYKFVKVHPRKITGITTQGRGSHEFKITDMEKTIVDCFDLPQYSGGFPELVRALYHADMNRKKLLEYAVVVDNLSVFKRISFLSELFEMKGFKTFHRETGKRLKNKYTLLSPAGGKTGRHLSRWKLCVNVDEKTLFSIIDQAY
mgnify:CR=1 FL=1